MDWADYLRDQAAKYRQLAETAEDPSIKQELLDLAAICEEAATLTSGVKGTTHALYCVLTWQAVIFAKTVF
jgi:hypothetical protein